MENSSPRIYVAEADLDLYTYISKHFLFVEYLIWLQQKKTTSATKNFFDERKMDICRSGKRRTEYAKLDPRILGVNATAYLSPGEHHSYKPKTI